VSFFPMMTIMGDFRESISHRSLSMLMSNLPQLEIHRCVSARARNRVALVQHAEWTLGGNTMGKKSFAPSPVSLKVSRHAPLDTSLGDLQNAQTSLSSSWRHCSR
jgi:hypothetical protein